MFAIVLTTALLCQTSPETAGLTSTLNSHFYHQFDSSITNGGDVSMNSVGAELRLMSEVTDEDDLEFRFQFQQDDWDFGGTAGLGGLDAWDKVNTIDMTVVWTHEYSKQDRWVFGGIVRASYETDASTNTQGGASVAYVHSFSSDLTLGGGVGVIGQANADPKAFPIIVLEWKLTDTLRLTSDLSTRFGSRTGLELVWTPRADWTFGAGYSYSYSRFRLNGNGFAPNGAAEATSYPLTLRATYHATPTFNVTIFGGIVFGGELEITNNARQLVQSTEYENAGTFGLFGKIRF
ncbi:MAG: hypothetical protein HOH93_01700 [Phycisphaerae bacterium]|nr:hypothetical protein [Phycisphaerae bacterium]